MSLFIHLYTFLTNHTNHDEDGYPLFVHILLTNIVVVAGSVTTLVVLKLWVCGKIKCKTLFNKLGFRNLHTIANLTLTKNIDH